jgi:hypothetical protein
MGKAFNMGFRIFSTLLGLGLIYLGAVFILQGLNLAFNGPIGGGPRSFMVGDPHWVLYGAIILLLGIGQAVWSVRRR